MIVQEKKVFEDKFAFKGHYNGTWKEWMLRTKDEQLRTIMEREILTPQGTTVAFFVYSGAINHLVTKGIEHLCWKQNL